MSKETLYEHITQLSAARQARLEALWRMTPSERVAAMRRGQLTMEQCCAWAARHPDQVPQINGEYEFLVAYTVEVCE